MALDDNALTKLARLFGVGGVEKKINKRKKRNKDAAKKVKQ